jgi:hypothetical protein
VSPPARRALALAALLLAAPSAAGDARAPCARREPERQAWFGDTHVHTSLSFDAWGQGTRHRPRDAYRFARGETLGIQPYDGAGGAPRTARLRRPLDFAAVTDHAELLGETRLCATPGAPGHGSLVCTIARRWPALGYMIVNSQMLDVRDPQRYGFCGPQGQVCREAAAGPWQEIRQAADEHQDRSPACRFTTFVGYEWSAAPDSRMLHRNVIFRSATVPELPASTFEAPTPEALWSWLEAECLGRGDGCDALAIPHNPNLSGGLLFSPLGPGGAPLTREEAARRGRLERLVEITQHKGDSECRPGAPDELCAFETLPFATMAESATPWSQTTPPAGSYLREGLAEGLRQHARIGANPFQLGVVGSTDTHLGTAGLVDEDRFPGHAAGRVTSRLRAALPPDDLRFNPGGLAVLWAEENSREALFEAMRRREAYGTSGPRIRLRFFGGWDYPESLCGSPRFAAQGYAAGVPMGGVLAAPPGSGAAPRFALSALADPGTADRSGTKLQRLQVVKIWLAGGETRERVYEVAGDPANGASVDATCLPRGAGFTDLCAVWRDPDFDRRAHALWYARAVENPSCRWNAFVCRDHGVDCAEEVPRELRFCCDPEVPRVIQERAWSSPIWYTPAGPGARAGG